MLRLSIIGFVVVIASLIGLALLPEQIHVNPEEDVHLYSSRMTLYPEKDAGATWRFAAETIRYNPVSRESTLLQLEDGARWVGDRLDFTLSSEEMVIDNQDNIRSESLLVHIVDLNWDLHMTSQKSHLVYISQDEGKFYAPRYTASGEGLGGENIEENVSLNFDLTDFQAGGPGTVGTNSFIDQNAN